MNQNTPDVAMKKPGKFYLTMNKLKTWFSKPQNIILLIIVVLFSVLVIFPLIMMLVDSFILHEGALLEEYAGEAGSLSLYSWQQMFTGPNSYKIFWKPFLNTMLMSLLSSAFAILFGGIVAYLVTRTNMKFRKWISSIFILPYIMPQWTLAVMWTNLFDSTAITATKDGLFTYLTGAAAPLWFVRGLFPTALVLGLHYAPFAYILIGGVFKNMDANLEEAATILNTPKWKIFTRITIPMIMPAILSTILLVFSSSMGSFPVPRYLAGNNFPTLAMQYMELRVNSPGVSSGISVVMLVIGLLILLWNQLSLRSRKKYTTVTGKSGQVTKVNLGKVGKWLIGVVLILITFFTSIFPIISFSLETFLANPGDYSHLTTMWWTGKGEGAVDALYGQVGILMNPKIWGGFGGTIIVSLLAAFFAGTIGLLVGYTISKNPKGKLETYTNSITFLPYLIPALSIGASYFVFGNQLGIWNTYLLLIIVGTIKYVPFASRSSISSMLQLSGEIEESAQILNVPWPKRMFRIIIPIQKTAIMSGFLLPFISATRELTLFMMLASDDKLATLALGYFDEMGLYAFSAAINLILIVFILVVNFGMNKLTGASLDEGIGG